MKIVLLPGLDGTGLLFRPLLGALPTGAGVLVIPYPEHERLGYGALVDYVMERLPDEPFVLVGESFSGYIAYRVALRQPGFLRGVVLVAAFLGSPRPLLTGLARFLPVGPVFRLPLPSPVLHYFLFGRTVNTGLAGLFRQALKGVSSCVLAFRLAEMGRMSPEQPLCAIKAVYIQASHDRLVPKGCRQDFERVFTGLELARVGGGHLVLQASPQACADIIDHFIKGISLSGNIEA